MPGSLYYLRCMHKKQTDCHPDNPFVFNLKSNTMKKHSANIVIIHLEHYRERLVRRLKRH